ncbi:MAG TPA: SRPBCC family protein [Myxococcaceae bacterium]|nr:SRPBCC family protein [Myxococcaceae bacterium]
MTKSKFVYVTYILATPEKVFRALTDPEFTRAYWSHDNVSDWKPGSAWKHVDAGGSRTVDILGEVVENRPPRRLVVTWAYPADESEKAKHSRVTFDVEPVEEMVRLTVTHDELDPASDMAGRIAQGWPRVLSSLKTLLETGKPLRTWAGRK